MELFWEKEFGADTMVSLLSGAILRLGESFALDAGVRIGHVASTNFVETRAGLTWAFKIWGA